MGQLDLQRRLRPPGGRRGHARPFRRGNRIAAMVAQGLPPRAGIFRTSVRRSLDDGRARAAGARPAVP